MEVALIVIVVILSVSLLAILLMRKKPEDVGALRSKVDEIASTQNNLRENFNRLEVALTGVQTKVVESTGSVEKSMLKDLAGVRETLVKITSDLEAGKKLEKELEESSHRIEAVVVGSRSRGKAGENILAEAFKRFPPQIVETNFKVKGKQVEYAMVLVDGKRIPIDSKWTRPELVENLDLEVDPAKREEIIKQIKDAVLSKAKEVTKYIDPSVTVLWGIAAVPDSVFAVCRDIHLDAFRERVIVMPHSLTIIYLLSLYQLHLQYCRSVDIERLKGYLDQIEQDLKNLDKELDNRIYTGTTMITNAFHECKRIIGEMRNATASLKALPTGGQAAQLESSEQSKAENNANSGS